MGPATVLGARVAQPIAAVAPGGNDPDAMGIAQQLVPLYVAAEGGAGASHDALDALHAGSSPPRRGSWFDNSDQSRTSSPQERGGAFVWLAAGGRGDDAGGEMSPSTTPVGGSSPSSAPSAAGCAAAAAVDAAGSATWRCDLTRNVGPSHSAADVRLPIGHSGAPLVDGIELVGESGSDVRTDDGGPDATVDHSAVNPETITSYSGDVNTEDAGRALGILVGMTPAAGDGDGDGDGSAASQSATPPMPTWREKALHISETKLFSFIIIMTTLYNVTILAADHHPQDETMDAICGFKLAGMGTRYFCSGYDIFDFALCLASIPEILAYFGAFDSSATRGGNALRAFRIMRVTRVFRVARVARLNRLREIMVTVLRSFRSVWWLSCLMMLFIFVFGVLGMHLFPRRLLHDGEVQRLNFVTFTDAILAEDDSMSNPEPDPGADLTRRRVAQELEAAPVLDAAYRDGAARALTLCTRHLCRFVVCATDDPDGDSRAVDQKEWETLHH
eukprot:gene29193-8124_t